MCTVTYFPLGNNDFIFTSNRDESPKRKTFLPKEYIENGIKMVFPKDKKAGGTWVGLSEKNRLVCLLNGGYRYHLTKGLYKMSRGLIVKKILSVVNPVKYIKNFDLDEIEPFTIVLIDWSNGLLAYELVWDGKVKHIQELPNSPKIWSSSTLYTDEMKEFRKKWFIDFIDKNVKFHQQKIIDFHSDDTRGELCFSVKMKRPFVETVSITSIKKESDKVNLTYLDFVNKKEVFLTGIFKK